MEQASPAVFEKPKKLKLESPIKKASDGTVMWHKEPGDMFIVTGVDRNGKRFSKQYSDWFSAHCINLWRGTKYLLRNGRRFKIVSVYN